MARCRATTAAAVELDDDVRRHVAQVMLEHARELFERVGYGTQLVLKGKQEPFDVRRVRWFASPG